MDVNDVSHDNEYVRFIKGMEATAQQNARRKGQIVRDHPPPEALVMMFMMTRYNTLAQTQGDAGRMNTMATSQVPMPYHPCTLPATALAPITISNMKLETHHRGHRIVVRALTPANRMTAVMAIVEDEQGTALLLQLYQQPEEELVPADEIIKHGGLYLIKEPFFKATTDGSYSIRADHVSDVLPLDKTHELVPSRWREEKAGALDADENKSHDLRVEGNKAVGNKNWAEAERLYSSAISASRTANDEQLALLNRSLANLKLGRPAKALKDARDAQAKGQSITEKSLFREASALYELGSFAGCLARLETLTAAFPSNDTVKPMMHRTKTRLHEQQTGEYDFRAMYRQSRATPPVIDCATYSAPVEIRESPGRGRGLFTTRSVAAGELLVCEKAFGYNYAGIEVPGWNTMLVNMATKNMTVGGQAGLLTKIVQKLYHDPEAARSFIKLHHGDYDAVAADEVDGRPVVDSFRVERVIALTGFGSPRNSRHYIMHMEGNDKAKRSHTTCGVYLIASNINHACFGNSRRSFIGDVLILRATCDMEADTELFFPYQPPLELQSFSDVQKRLANWGFTCQCSLCLARKNTPKTTLARRKELYRELDKAMGAHGTTPKPVNFSAAWKVLEKLEQTFSEAEKGAGGLRFDLWDPLLALGRLYLNNGKPAEAIATTVKSLEALGFVISACPPKGKGAEGKQQPELVVKKWGLAQEYCMGAFLNLVQAYQQVAPSLVPVARQYLSTMFSILVGENETISDVYPEFR